METEEDRTERPVVATDGFLSPLAFEGSRRQRKETHLLLGFGPSSLALLQLPP